MASLSSFPEIDPYWFGVGAMVVVVQVIKCWPTGSDGEVRRRRKAKKQQTKERFERSNGFDRYCNFINQLIPFLMKLFLNV